MNTLPQHILHITPRYMPSMGGVEKHVHEVSKLLVAAGYEITVVTAQHDSTLPLEEEIDSVQILRIPRDCTGHKVKTWQWFWQYKNIFSGKKIFIHDVAWQIFPLLPMLYKNFCLVSHGWEGIYPIPQTNILQRNLFSHCAHSTIHVGKFIEEFYGTHPTAVIYGGVTLPNFTNATLQKTTSKKLQFAFIGRLEKVNEVEKYLEFFALLQKQNSNFSVVWVGDGSYRTACEQVGTVTGMITDIESHLRSADFVCANSYLSVLEAQAAGKIVLSFYTNTVKERYLKTYPGAQYMLISDSATSMVKDILELLENKATLVELQNKARQVAQVHTWQKVAALYEKIANRL